MVYQYLILLSWVTFIIYWIVASFNIKRDISHTIWWRSAWIRISLIIFVFGWLSEGYTRAVFYSLPHALPAYFGIIGTVICLAGTGLAIWARIHLGRNWSPAPAIKEEHELVTSGPYRLIRHPIYTGILAATIGTAFAEPAWLIMVWIIAALFVWRVGVEEQIMNNLFSSRYTAYKKHTWALIPYIW